MVQVHVPAREWGFDSPPGHHPLFDVWPGLSRGKITMSERDQEPGFGDLVLTNLKLVGVVMVGLALAWGAWRGLAWLFPDISWLQIQK